MDLPGKIIGKKTFNMQLQFTNRQIFFAVSQCWEKLHFRLKTHLQDLVLANDEPAYLQSVTITPDQLGIIYKSVSGISEGEARAINAELKNSLMQQLAPLMTSNDEEALAVISKVQEIDAANENTLQAKIDSGKSQILA